ncbi:restriction endonuclease subunit S [Silanimonas sp.]|uniref:restriction endonuclease subunit S n=1 Tax=Silanimonas sp. TaxID=1929290 RepID=UPI0037C87A3E
MSAGEARPQGWVRTFLGDIATFEMGQAPPGSASNFVGEGTVFVKAGEFGVTTPLVREWTTRPLKFARSGDVLICVVGATAGKLNLGIDCSIGRSVAAIRPSSAIDQRALYFQLLPRFETMRAAASGSAQGVISQTDLSKLSIDLPPINEQKRIVAKLEELLSDLDAGVAELKAAQQKLQRYRQSLLKAAVEGALTAEWRQKNPPTETGAELLQRILRERRARWEEQQLAKFTASGKAPPNGWKDKYPEPQPPKTEGLPELPEGWVWASVEQLSPNDLANGRSVPTAASGARVLRLTAVKGGRIDLSEYKVGEWTDDEARPFAVAENDLLIVRGNGSLALVGRAGLVGPVDMQVAFPDTLIRLRIINSVASPAWLGLVWDSPFVRNHLEDRARTSAGIYKISQPDIESALIPIPPLVEQTEILKASAQLEDEIRATEVGLAAAFTHSSAQRQNVLRAAFRGELVPQDPNDEPASVLLDRLRAERAVAKPVKAERKTRKAKGAA